MKQNAARAVSVFMTILTLWYFNEVLCVNTMHGSSQARAMYFQPRDKVDVVMMGSSHIHCDIDTGILWNEFGIAAYDYSAAEQPLWCTYYYLREFCKYQKPKVMVLDLYSPARFKDDYQYLWLNENLCGMRLSLNKIGAVLASAEKDRIKDFFPSFSVYHDKIRSVKMEDLLFPLVERKEFGVFKGYTPFFGTSSLKEHVVPQANSGGLTLKSEIYLGKIIDFAEKNDIEIFLMVSPYVSTVEDETVYNRIREIAGYHGLNFKSSNYEYDEIGLDFSSDFNEESHLNYWGAQKFTRYLGNELLARFDIPDRRGSEGYESWDENYEAIIENAEESIRLQELEKEKNS